MKTLRIFVDFSAPADVMEILRTGAAGHKLIFPRKPGASVLVKAEPDPEFASVDVAFGQPDPQAVAHAKQLKWIHISTSGITRYDTPEFRALMAERQIAVSNSASVYSEACAVHALTFMLAQARQLSVSLKTRTTHVSPAWHALRAASKTLRGETILIVGYGAIGRRLTELLRPFEMQISAYRRNPRGDESVPLVSKGGMVQALGQADHVMNILPESGDTRHFFNRARLDAMKRGAIFYNIGRGATVDQQALREGLASGAIGAAWLDVTEPEPLPEDHPLWSQPNCFITPHVAGGHADEAKTLVNHFLRNLDRYGRGEPLLDRVV
ncbi:MAG TPA: D-2-hydroxyacid dehydrogenase [Clostridia bacterium]|nr:D-2-hydroxyacid dehydrogenase [Clostridia bacterium]